jgi:hypothetical protein
MRAFPSNREASPPKNWQGRTEDERFSRITGGKEIYEQNPEVEKKEGRGGVEKNWTIGKSMVLVPGSDCCDLRSRGFIT